MVSLVEKRHERLAGSVGGIGLVASTLYILAAVESLSLFVPDARNLLGTGPSSNPLYPILAWQLRVFGALGLVLIVASTGALARRPWASRLAFWWCVATSLPLAVAATFWFTRSFAWDVLLGRVSVCVASGCWALFTLAVTLWRRCDPAKGTR